VELSQLTEEASGKCEEFFHLAEEERTAVWLHQASMDCEAEPSQVRKVRRRKELPWGFTWHWNENGLVDRRAEVQLDIENQIVLEPSQRREWRTWQIIGNGMKWPWRLVWNKWNFSGCMHQSEIE
jgi:hypothetical protein